MGTIIKGKEIANKYKKEISDFVENRKKEFKRKYRYRFRK